MSSFLLSLLGLVPTFQTAKCKKLLNITMERIKLLSSRREAQLRQLRIDLAELLQLGKEQKAQVWAGRIYKELNLRSVYLRISTYCKSVQLNLKDIAGQNACPEELEEPLAGLCFAASCCADLPELQELREIFAMKYGKRFVSSAQELGQKFLVKEEALEEEIAEGDLKQGKERVPRQHEQETQAIVYVDACNQCSPHHEQEDLVSQTVEAMDDSEDDGEKVLAIPAVQEFKIVSRVCEEGLRTRSEVAQELATLKKKTSESRQRRRCWAFKRACKRRQASVNTCNDEEINNSEEPAMKGEKHDMEIVSVEACNASQGNHGIMSARTQHHEAPLNQHLVLYVEPPRFSLPPQRPPPSPPRRASLPPRRAPPPPAPLRVSSMPSSRYMKHQAEYSDAPHPLRCSTMASRNKVCGETNYNHESHVHPRLPNYEDLVANFTALKHY